MYIQCQLPGIEVAEGSKHGLECRGSGDQDIGSDVDREIEKLHQAI